MYIPSHFRETDERVLAEFIDAYAFGTLVTVEGARPSSVAIERIE